MSSCRATNAKPTKLPKLITVAIPIFQAWPQKYEVVFRLAFRADENGKKIAFTLVPRNWDDVRDAAVNDMLAHARKELGEHWLIVRGTPKTAKLAD